MLKAEELARKVAYHGWSDLENGCWEWNAYKNIGGYPVLAERGVPKLLTRLILAVKIGRDLTNEEKACHICDYPPCMNPNHIYVGTQKQNMQDRRDRGRDPRKLKPEQEAKILELSKLYKQSTVASMTGVVQGTVSVVVRRNRAS